MTTEVHEHPLFNGQYHEAVWIQSWYSSNTVANETGAPEGIKITCAICGKVRQDGKNKVYTR